MNGIIKIFTSLFFDYLVDSLSLDIFTYLNGLQSVCTQKSIEELESKSLLQTFVTINTHTHTRTYQEKPSSNNWKRMTKSERETVGRGFNEKRLRSTYFRLSTNVNKSIKCLSVVIVIILSGLSGSLGRNITVPSQSYTISDNNNFKSTYLNPKLYITPLCVPVILTIWRHRVTKEVE